MPVVTLPLLEIVRVTPRSRLIVLGLDAQTFPFLAGQAVMVGQHGGSERRPYSIASSPQRVAETGTLELLVVVDARGAIGSHLPALAPGARVDIEGPLGSFTFPDAPAQRRLLFVAGGSGIAPLRAMLDHALRRHPTEQISVLYSARRADEFAFVDELNALAQAGRIELHCTVTRDDGSWEGGRGRIGRSHFEAVLHDRLDTLCFVCGPSRMVAESVLMLGELGVPADAIRTEQWQK